MHAVSANYAEYRFGDLELRTATHEVSVSGSPVDLPPLSFRLLEVLAESAPALVSHDELIDRVWSGRVVSPETVTQRVKLLRQALGDNARRPKYIGVVRGLGYRLLPEEGPVVEAEPALHAAQRRHRRWLAAAGGVAMVTVILLAAAMGRPSSPFFEYARTGNVDRTQPPPPAAQQQLEMAKFFYHRRSGPSDLDLAEQHYRAALKIDSGLASAWVGLAAVEGARSRRALSAVRGPSPFERNALQTALRLDPNLAEAHARLSRILRMSGDDEEAERHWERALALAPDDPMIVSMRAGELLCRGDIESAVAMQRRAVALNPLSRADRGNLAVMLLVSGRPNEAETEFRAAHALDPGQPDSFEMDIAQIRILQGRYAEALVLAETLSREEDRLAVRAMAHHSLGQEREATDAIELLQRTAGPWAAIRLTEVSAFLGQQERSKMAISTLQAIVTEGAASKDELDDALAALEFSPFTWELWLTEPWQSRWQTLLASLRELA